LSDSDITLTDQVGGDRDGKAEDSARVGGDGNIGVREGKGGGFR